MGEELLNNINFACVYMYVCTCIYMCVCVHMCVSVQFAGAACVDNHILILKKSVVEHRPLFLSLSFLKTFPSIFLPVRQN